MASKSSSGLTVALAVTLGLGALGICYFLWSTSSPGDGKQEDSNKKDVKPSASSSSSAAAPAAAAGGMEEPALKAAYDEAIRSAKKNMGSNNYVAAAEQYGRAIELAEHHLPSCAKDVLTLYNNRSAMYEKAGDLDKALRDITMVLRLDGFHLKARVRRARIYEQQGKGYEALDDYVVTMLVERAKVRVQPRGASRVAPPGRRSLTSPPSVTFFSVRVKNLPPTTSQKADEVCKQVSSSPCPALPHPAPPCPALPRPTPPHPAPSHPTQIMHTRRWHSPISPSPHSFTAHSPRPLHAAQVASRETSLLLAAIRDPPANAPPVSAMLPTKAYCRNFFEAFPATYR